MKAYRTFADSQQQELTLTARVRVSGTTFYYSIRWLQTRLTVLVLCAMLHTPTLKNRNRASPYIVEKMRLYRAVIAKIHFAPCE